MFKFAEPLYLLALAVLPMLVVMFWVYRRRQRAAIDRFAERKLFRELAPAVSVKRGGAKFTLMVASVGILIFALAQPQFGSKLQTQQRRGVEIVIATDVSRSMLAEDFKPNRLERTKNAVSRLVERLGEHRVGLVVFAGDAYVQLPVTSDYVAAANFISSINTEMVPRQGTSLAAALDMSVRSFSEESGKSRAVILITDGESHDDEPLEAARRAEKAGVVVYTVGVGTPEGTAIEINGEMIRDDKGEIVVSKLDEAALEEIAKITGGEYIRASKADIGLQSIVDHIDKMEKEEFTAKIYQQYNDQFHYLLLVVLVILTAEFVILERKSTVLGRFRFLKF